MIKFLNGEEWAKISMPHKTKMKYAVSNLGRVISYSDTVETGRLLNLTTIEGYKLLTYKVYTGKKISNKSLFVRRLVAQYFLPPPTRDQKFVLLIDRNRKNNKVDNLKWATKDELYAHTRKSPYLIRATLKKRRTTWGKKLDSTKVLLLKQKLLDPNRKTRLKILAKQYGVSEMALQRIKTGENWGYIKVKGMEKKK